MIVLTILNSVLLLLIIAYMIKFMAPKKEEPKPKLTDKDKKKLEEAKQAFNNLMGYDYDKALKRK